MKMGVGIKLGLWLALLGTLSTGLIAYYVYQRSQDILLRSSQDKILTATQVLGQNLQDALSGIASDVKFIRALPQTKLILEQAATSSPLPARDLQFLAQVFSSLLSARPEYAQVRLIDALHYGKELVRVDRDRDDIKVIDHEHLQEKSHFPYVFETSRLAAGQLYLSEINLNQELGTHVGFGKPTVRIATPLKDAADKTLGIVVINVDLDGLFARIRTTLPRDFKILLTNSRGDYLIHPDAGKSFAFERGQQFRIQDDIAASQQILSGEREHLVASSPGLPGGDSLAALVRLPLNAFAEQPTILLGLYTSRETILADNKTLGANVVTATAVFATLAIAISLILARFLTQPLKQMADALSRFELGQTLQPLPKHRSDEIGLLSKSFAAMTNKLNQQIGALHTSEAKLRTILDNLPLGIWLIGVDQETRFLNKSFRDDLGLDEQRFFSDPRFAQLLQWPEEQITRDELSSTLSLPFSDGEQHWLEVHKVKIRSLSGTLIAMIGIAIDITERKKAEKVLRSSEEKLRTLFELSPLGIARNTLDGRFIEVNRAFRDMVGYDLNQLNQLSYWDLTPAEYESQEQVQLASLSDQGRYGPYEKEYMLGDGKRVPVRLNGVLITDSDGEQYIWSIVEDITQSKQSEQVIWHQANFDPLTGLPNRRMFHDRLNFELVKAHRNGIPLALIFLDLDRFKEVNDTLGHDMGDLLLQDTAQRLHSCVRESDTVARLGGDEFTLVLCDIEDSTIVERIVHNILFKLAQPFQLKDKQVYVSASIGVTFYPKDAGTSDALIKNADQAMYAAKQQGRNRHCYFTPAMHEAALTRMRIASDLREALAQQQFELFFQPVVELASGRISKAEALLRWHHPLRGLVSPADFIPIAEDIGILNDIGDWVFFETCRLLMEWRSQYLADLQISINKSPMQFLNCGQHHQIWLDHLQQLGLPGDSLVVEITEGLLLEANAEAIALLKLLRNGGVQIALDDFGTGYSSLAYLKHFTIDYIKIDRSFIGHLSLEANDMALCEAIIVMAHKLGIKVIAEGIESETQRDLLIAANCDYGQGYLFLQPLPAEEFGRFLATLSKA